MIITEVGDEHKKEYDSVVFHPLQSFEWGEFRRKTKVKVIRRIIREEKEVVDGFSLTIHPIPYTPFTIGYLPKGDMPKQVVIEELLRIGRENNCIFIQLEPNIKIENSHFAKASRDKRESRIKELIQNSCLAGRQARLKPSFHPLFTKHTFVLDLTKSEQELLASMHPKTRYNIKVAIKHGVEIVEDNSEEAFETYLSLVEKTTARQKFYAHSQSYHRLMWETLKAPASPTGRQNLDTNKLSAHLLLAKYHGEVLVAWVLFVFKDTLYYPYGASSSEHRETMASNLMMWETIHFGKRIGLKKFDMWGALGENPDTNDPWYGFHKFKQGYGSEHIEFIGSFDLVINPILYKIYKIADKLRWVYLRLRK